MAPIVSSEPNQSEAFGDSISSFFEGLPVTDRPGDGHRLLWTQWLGKFSHFGSKCTLYPHDKCWGNTILRTSYEDDAKFASAIAAIHRLAMVPVLLDYELRGTRSLREQDPPDDDGPELDRDFNLEVSETHPEFRQMLQDTYRNMVRRAIDAAPPGTRCTHDWVMTHELVRRYHNIIVEDKEALDGVDPAAAWQYFQHHGCQERESGLRGTMFVFLDKEAIDHLASTPTEEELASMSNFERVKVAWQHWIKVISPLSDADDEGEDLDTIHRDHTATRRVRLFDYIDIFLWLQHYDIMDMPIEGNKHERFPGHLERPWEFCDNPDGTTESWRLLDQLYGPRVR
ncbi:hypothetical protein F5X68DRAFT_238158 [Plectosphaerella plurivora]|uniref:Uncharacterized protein n=1 Tax=Plectosphaerella plurivora TaxID=936078 RepID=A0A9P8VLY4_9PEZI|nr:hypothetical protein F5X68DRAFT_238158 [Plectosphaerella plurivora]